MPISFKNRTEVTHSPQVALSGPSDLDLPVLHSVDDLVEAARCGLEQIARGDYIQLDTEEEIDAFVAGIRRRIEIKP